LFNNNKEVCYHGHDFRIYKINFHNHIQPLQFPSVRMCFFILAISNTPLEMRLGNVQLDQTYCSYLIECIQHSAGPGNSTVLPHFEQPSACSIGCICGCKFCTQRSLSRLIYFAHRIVLVKEGQASKHCRPKLIKLSLYSIFKPGNYFCHSLDPFPSLRTSKATYCRNYSMELLITSLLPNLECFLVVYHTVQLTPTFKVGQAKGIHEGIFSMLAQWAEE